MKRYINDINEELQQHIAEKDALRCELKIWADTCQRLEDEKRELQKQYDELLQEVAYLRGQIIAFECCISKGR